MSEIYKSIISSIFIAISLYAFGYIVFDKHNDQNQKKVLDIVVLIISIILYTIVYLYLKGTAKTLLLCILFMFTLKEIFKIHYAKALFATIIYTILLIIPDLITTSIIINIFNVGKEKFYSDFAGGIICNASVCFLMISLTFILRKPLRKLSNYNVSTSKKIFIVSILTISFIAMFFYKFATKYKASNDVIFYLLAILSFMAVLFMLLKENLDSNILKNRYDELLEIMKTYENDVEEQRTIFHETKNEIMTIRCKISDKEDSKEVIRYIDSIMGDKNKSRNNLEKYAKFKYLPSNGLKGFFYYKFMEAEKKDIKVSVNISKSIENSFLGNLETISFKQLIRIIGVYLDNAIDASYLSQDKRLGIEVYQFKDEINIIISNTFNNSIDINKMGKAKFSTKGVNHGHGLLLVKSILNNSKIFKSKSEIKNNIFIQKLIIKNN